MDLDPRSVEADLAAYYDQEAEERANRAMLPRRVETRRSFIDQLVQADRPSRPVLEVGIGPGVDAAAFLAAGLTVIGVDLSVEHARRATGVGAATSVASVRSLPFRDGVFGALWTMSTLMHVPNVAIASALGELHRVLAPGALCGIGVWGGPNVEDLNDRDTYEPRRLFSRRSNERWLELLATIGTVERFDPWEAPPGAFWYQWAVVRRP